MAEGVSHQSLYRRYRPQRFAEVRGQDDVVKALRNAVREDRVGHAYLFSGPRGTGKTSTARILAKAINCLDPREGDACDECESCVAIRSGRSFDVVEMDAASKRKLEEMRDLLATVSLASPGRRKVYIIDEVHALDRLAVPALLKTLEEPPDHVVFVLATTDPQKVGPTIRSRTQHFDFHLLAADELTALVRDVNEAAGLELTEADLEVVVRRGAGSARDTLSVLDQAAAAGEMVDDVADVAEVVEGLCERDAGRVLVAVAGMVAAGRDPQVLTEALIGELRRAFLITLGAGHLVAASADDSERLGGQARRLGAAGITRAIETLGSVAVDMREALDTRTALEVALVRLARPDADASPAALLERIERLERALAGGAALPAPASTGATASSAAEPSSSSAASVPSSGSGPADTEASTPGAGRSGAAEARRVLNESRGQGARAARPATTGPAPSGAIPPPPDMAPTRPAGGGASVPGASAAPVSPSPEAPGRSPAAPAAPATTTASGSDAPAGDGRTASGPGGASPAGARSASSVGDLPGVDELTRAWEASVLERLSPGVKALYRVGRFVEVIDGQVVFGLPNEPHIRASDRRRPDVEAALSEHFGRPVRLRLVVDDEKGAAGSGGGGSDRSGPFDDESIDRQALAAMADAPPGPTAEEKLMQAFPGAEEVQDV